MSRHPRQRSETGIYHVMLRGINRQRVFESELDYEYYLNCLSRVKDTSNVTILAYCLMSNHIHLLIEEGWESVSVTIKRLGVMYAGWFNQRYDRVGHLFQDRFRSKPVTDDAYFLMVWLYIHFNPVAAGVCERPDEYDWSSRSALTGDNPLVDIARLGQFVPVTTLLAEEARYKPSVEREASLLGGEVPAVRLTDPEAWQVVQDVTGVATGSAFQRLSRARQLAAARSLRARGLSVRQIARLTGMNKNSVLDGGR